MSARKRIRRPVGSGVQRRFLLPRLEDLESRLVLSQNGLASSAMGPPASGPPGPVLPPSPPSSNPVGVSTHGRIPRPISSVPITPPIIIKSVPGPDGRLVPFQSSSPVGYTPAQVRGAYGVDLVMFGNVQGDGSGQTIALIDAGDNTGFQDTGPKFQGSSLQVFDKTFGLPDPPSFQKFNQTGGKTLPAPIPGWGEEIALDVEWAHSIAPMANIDLVEGNDATNTDLFTAMQTAGTTLGASVISMSFGAFLEFNGFGSLEQQLDSQYMVPTLNANPNLTLLASTGDSGSFFGPSYPSISPYVAGIGGTSLNIGGKNNWVSETGWSGSGGGISNTYTPEPPWQSGLTGETFRTNPDVSAVADPNTGVAVYDSGDFTPPDAWIQVGGTSLSSPIWSGIMAMVDQGRSEIGLPALNGPNQLLPAVYALYSDPVTYAADFHDITTGNSGLYSAGTGYDLVTGIGSPIVNRLVPDLVDFGAATSAAIEFQPPSDVIASSNFGTAVQALDAKGNVVNSYEGSATISLVSGPAGANFTPQTIKFSGGVALFNSLSLNQVSATTPYVFQIVVQSQGATLGTVTTDPVMVTQSATPGVGVYYPVPLDASLRSDVGATETNTQSTNDVYLVYPNPFPITFGQILLQNPTPAEPKVLNFLGQGQSASVITSNYTNRLFEITGTVGSSPSMRVVFQDLTLTGGLATDEADLPLPGILSLGGAILMNGGAAALTDVAVKSNVALGQTGAAGTNGSFAGPGGPGTNGGVAQGGGIYLAAGNLTLKNDTMTGNVAQGGLGGVGGRGGAGGFSFSFGGGSTTFFPVSISGGQGGVGGRGGSAAGGALYVAGGSLTINGGTVVGNTAQGGAGGTGGDGGRGGTANRRGGGGGLGGAGAAGNGGAIYLARGSVTIDSATIQSDSAVGGVGGAGGAGGKGGGNGIAPPGVGGGGGKGAPAAGGGLYISSGSVTWAGSVSTPVLSFDIAAGGAGGANGTGTGHGQTGAGAGGGIYAAGAFNLAGGVALQNNTATSGGGIYAVGKLTVGAITFSNNTSTFGGAVSSGSKLTVNGATFIGNTATDGGAIYAPLGLVLASGTFTGNTASNDGGAIAVAGPLSMSGGTFSGNSAYAGGAIDTSGSATITGVSLSGNSATLGGAVANEKTGILTVSNQTFTKNSATADGGGIANFGTLTLSNATFTANGATDLGGGLYNELGTATISKSTFSNNTGNGGGATSGFVGGGAIGNNGGALTLSYITFQDNTAVGGYGGAIASEPIGSSGSVSLTYAVMSGNSAQWGGAVSNYAAMTITNTTIDANAASFGGAVQNGGNLTLTNATLAGNTGVDAGGGVYNGAGTLTTVNVTIAGNQVVLAGVGGGLDSAGGVATLYNTIVASNTIGSGSSATPSDINTSGTGTISGASAFNMIGVGGSGGLVQGVNGNLVNVASPNLDILRQNGGQNMTVALLAGSPAIDSGSASIAGVTIPTVDQRGAVRGGAGLNAGANPDIGAYEASSSFLVTSNVDTTDAGTLRSAIAWSDVSSNANPANLANPAPNTVVFNTSGVFKSPQTIVLTGGPLDLANTVTGVAIAGPGASQVTISGNNTSGVVIVEQNTTATLSGITITAGSAANGAGALNLGKLTVSNAAVSFNTSSNNGGGIDNLGTLAVINSQIASNTSSQGGGGVANELGATMSLSGASIVGNSASAGGGLLNLGVLSIAGTTFSGNSATTVGGGLDSSSATPVTIQGSTFATNTATSGAGIYATGMLTVSGSTISSNSATGAGGGITSTGNLTVVNTTLTGNSALGAGGAIEGPGTFAVNQSTVSSNKAGSGGGIADQGTGTITDSNLTGNSATGLGGGGVYNAGTLTVMRSTFSTNSGSSGGAFYNDNQAVLGLLNSTIASNTAAAAGAGLYNLAGFNAVNTTIAENNVTAGTGGGLDAVTGTATLYNTIVALNTHGTGADLTADDIVGSPATVATASSYNLVGVGGSGGLIQGNNGNQVGVANPGLGTLASNGGPMQTISLLSGSPAVDGGTLSVPSIPGFPTLTVPTADERGAQRGPTGLNAGPTVDIGAYEASSSYVVNTTADNNAIGTLRTAVAWANVSSNANPANVLSPAPNTVQFGIPTADPGYNGVANSWTVTLSGSPLSLTGTSVAESIVGLGPNAIVLSGNNASGVLTVGGGVTASLTGVTITAGNSAAKGGGIDNSGTLTASNLMVSGNAAASGGGIANEASGVLGLANVTLTGDVALTTGGGLFNAGALTLSHSAISGNQAATGGGIDNVGTFALDQTPVTDNTATTKGGGIANSGTMTISFATLGNNQANGAAALGGAADNSGTLSVTNSTLLNNTAGKAGGGIENESAGTVTLTNTTLGANSATSGGGLDNNGTTFLINVTVAYNNVAAGGSGAGLNLAAGGRAALYNTLIGLNTSGVGAAASASDITGTVSAASRNNLVGVGGTGGMTNNVNGNVIGVATKTLQATLGTLPPTGIAQPPSNNGGPTDTVALLAGSPAIDAGIASILGVNIPTTDQRGAVRGPAGLNAGGNPDIGAYEASSSFVVTSPANTLDAGTLPTAVSWADFSTNANPANIAKPAPNTIVFDTTGVFSSPQTINLRGVTLSLANANTGVSINGPGGGIVTVSGNQAGGVFVVPKGATVVLSGITITGGSATNGGGVDNMGTLSLTNSTVSGNSATGAGGGIDNETGANLTVLGSTFSGNTAANGGGLANSGTATLTDSTFANNSANQGGGINNSGTLTLLNNTIAYNTVASGGAGAGLDEQASGTALLANTIIAKNSVGTGTGAQQSDIAGTVSGASAFNLIGSGGSGGLSNGTNGNQVGVANPGLASALGNNGGPTRTIALLAASPALNTGNSKAAGLTAPITDQRGALRAFGLNPLLTTLDIGAYETTSSYLVTSAADSLNTGTLRSAVDFADSNPGGASGVTNMILFDTAPGHTFSSPQTITLSANLGTLALTNTTTPVLISVNNPGVVSVSGNGAVGVFSIAPGATVTMDNLTITAGSALSGGGISNSGNLTITAGTFTNNSAVYYGGAIYNNGGVVTVTNSTFAANTATFGQGGAIDNAGTATAGGTLTVSNSSFTGGVAFQGGAINNKYGTLTVTGTNMQNNTGTEGGGIFNNATATVTDSTIANNIAHDGGGIANDLIGTLYLANSTIAGNSGGNNGGGVNSAGISTIVNSTIAYNSVIPGGPGGGIDVASGTTTIYNTIVALNTAGTGSTATPNDVGGTLASASANNLIGSSGGGLANGVNNNIIKPAVVGLGTLGNYGGPLQTVSLLATSPAIDAGANSITIVPPAGTSAPAGPTTTLTIPTIDERGALRGPAGLNAGTNVDIGAYEASSSYLVSATADGTTAGTLREAVSWANKSTNANPLNVKTPAPNTIVFDTAHAFSTPQTITLTSGPLALANTTTPIAISGSATVPVTISGGGNSGDITISAGTKVSMSYLTITGGSAQVIGSATDGGGIDNSGTLTLTNSSVTGSAAVNGGGIANEVGGTLTLVGSTVANNWATTGGGVYNAGTLTMTNSTVANNGLTGVTIVALQGGGIFNAGKLTAINSTIAYNTVANGATGGGIDTIVPSAVSLYNTIVARNTAGTTTLPTASDIAGTVAAASAFNLIGTGNSGGLTNGVNGNQVGVANPGLAATLASNGGPTQTIALLTGSPAAGKGSSTISGVTVPTTDQRGVARPASRIDVGAFQLSTGTSGTTGTSGKTSQSSTGSSPKLVVGSTSTKPSGGSAAKLHAAAKPRSGHSVSLAKSRAVKRHK
jgi:predicted outer membrane repeat protein